MKRILLTVMLASGLAATLATSLTAQPAREIFAEGETLDFVVTWLKVTGGNARMTIAPSGADKLRITSVAKSSGSVGRLFRIRDEIETIVARDDFSTLRYTKRLDERGDKEREVTVVSEKSAARTRNGKTKTIAVPDPIFDPISVVYYFRTLELAPGKAYDLTLISDGKVYTVKAKVVRREVIDTPAGRYTTLLVEPEMLSGGVAREERLFIWYTDDERHIPVRIRTEVKFGSVVASLRSMQRGVTTVDPPTLR